jgi:hypothetical protein
MNSKEIQELTRYSNQYGINIVNCENYNGTLEAHYGIFQSVMISDDLPLDAAKSIIQSIVRLYPIAKIEKDHENKIIEILKHKNIVDLEIMKLQELQSRDEKQLQELIRMV